MTSHNDGESRRILEIGRRVGDFSPHGSIGVEHSFDAPALLDVFATEASKGLPLGRRSREQIGDR